MLAEELIVVDAASPLWNNARPLLDIALKIEQQNGSYTWHGWQKESINAFMQGLPAHCALIAGVWQEDVAQQQESLWLGCVLEVREGVVCSIRTFAAFEDAGLPPTTQLEPGFAHAQELLSLTKSLIAPVAWALFTDKTTWDEWLLTDNDVEQHIDKGQLLASFSQQGRCVLLGSQVSQHRHHL
ncbi:hypothetical protein KDA_00780 [Dictyobacter alpinus]|uniref:Uncharacterized protein n=1 Tax=Dictyobacter alpinus TaxID=2014873 RepID=A0A402AZP5_9CHLR|nr:hypothetical protein [Dictyobacter alpinus]GCE24594.1 hypothetical protein KDA_00780 [Dictyobacter alpinus]